MGSKGVLICVLVTAATLLFEKGKSRAVGILKGERSLHDVKFELIRPSVILGLLCTALMVVICKKMEGTKKIPSPNSISFEGIPWIYLGNTIGYHVGKWFETKMSANDETFLPFFDQLIINILFVISFSSVSFVIEHILNCGAHLSWLIYFSLTILFIWLS